MARFGDGETGFTTYTKNMGNTHFVYRLPVPTEISLEEYISGFYKKKALKIFEETKKLGLKLEKKTEGSETKVLFTSVKVPLYRKGGLNLPADTMGILINQENTEGKGYYFLVGQGDLSYFYIEAFPNRNKIVFEGGETEFPENYRPYNEIFNALGNREITGRLLTDVLDNAVEQISSYEGESTNQYPF
jgi:hypothetical protein